MSGISQYQSVFRIAKHDASNNGIPSKITKRNRQPVSCTACRVGKLKCDRQLPCMSCSKRGNADSCNYFNGSLNGHDRRSKDSRDSEAQLRLQKLEKMVTELIQTATGESETPSDNSSRSDAVITQRLKTVSVYHSPQVSHICPSGHLDVNDSETNYHDASHWAAILEHIREIQGVLEPSMDDGDEATTSDLPIGPDIVLDTNRSLTLTEVCKSLPSRPRTDRMLSVFFNANSLQMPIIHSGKFMREYESFWSNPSSVSFLWISILFSALYIGSQIDQAMHKETSDVSGGPSISEYFLKAGQALIAGKYHKARPSSVEAVLLYAACKYSRKEDPDADTWMIMGIGVRLAMRMGYHRDPRYFPNISPFEGEMRRRVFFIINTFDLLLSFQAGLPAIVDEELCDTEPPRNLFDTDFTEDCKVIPSSRPPTDHTPMLYYCYKARLTTLFRRIYRHALTLKPRLYEITMQFDRALNEIHEDVPPSLRMRPLSSAVTDQKTVILQRLYVDLFYRKILCVLHRNYLSHDKSNPTFEYSRKTCSDSALQLLAYQAEMHAMCQPGGRFHDDTYMTSNITLHDFLMAAMITCLDLYESFNRSAASCIEDSKRQREKYDALRLSHEIWMSRSKFSRDARRASNVLAVMLSRIPRPSIPLDPQNTITEIQGTSGDPMNGDNTTRQVTNPTLSTPWQTNGYTTENQEFLVDDYAPSDTNPSDPLNMIFDNSQDINWGLVDQSLLGPNGVDEFPLDWHLPDDVELPFAP